MGGGGGGEVCVFVWGHRKSQAGCGEWAVSGGRKEGGGQGRKKRVGG